MKALRLTTEQRDFLQDVCSRSNAKRAPALKDLRDLLRGDQEVFQLLDILECQSHSAGKATRSTKSAHSYADHRSRVAMRERAKSASGREIGIVPDVVDPKRKAKAKKSLKFFLETYLARWFPLKWSKDHLRIIKKIETAVKIGGCQAIAMPRGSGKTTICQGAALWAAMHGFHKFLMLLQANKDKAQVTLEVLKMELELNPLFAEDYPEVVYPIQCLERIPSRAKGQTCQGKPTYLQWAANKMVFATLEGAESAGVVVSVGGLLEALRGALFAHPATRTLIRPSFALVDDPQTTESAKSDLQCDLREKLIRADLLGCAGPGMPFAALMPITVIEPGDVASRFLDRERNPEWRGERRQLLLSFPTNMELWLEYDAVRRRCLKIEDDDDEPLDAFALYAEANAFYRKHRKAMDEGAAVSWEERKYEYEVSAIQHAMNLYLRDPGTFWTEYQNDPLSAIEEDETFLSSAEIVTKVSGYDRLQVAEGCQFITGHVDVQQRILYYTLMAWTPYFDGYIIDRGTFPKQRNLHFTEKSARPTLQEVFPRMGLEAQLLAGVTAVCDYLFGLRIRRVDGYRMPINLLMIDSKWKPHVIFEYCQNSPYEARVVPSIGRYIGPDQIPLSQCKPRRGEYIGMEWTIPAVRAEQVRQVQFDTNFWKTFFHRRLATPLGDRGSVSLYGKQEHGLINVDHSFYAEHLVSEYCIQMTGMKRTCDVWKEKPGDCQNHWYDTSVGATVAASVLGATILGSPRDLAPAKSKGRIIRYG